MRFQGDLLNLTQFIFQVPFDFTGWGLFFKSTYKKHQPLINYKTHGWLCQPRLWAFFLFPPLPSSPGKALGTRMLLCHFFLAPRLLLKCAGSKQSRVRWSAFKGRLLRRTIPPNPSVLVRPNQPDLWKNESNKVWLWGLLKKCSYPLRTYAWFLLYPCLLTRMDSEDMANSLTIPERAEYWGKSCKGILVQGWPGMAYFTTRDLRPSRNMMSSCSLAQKQHPSTPRTASLFPWFGYPVGPVKLQSNGCELGTRIPKILFALIFAWDFKMPVESQPEVPKR